MLRPGTLALTTVAARSLPAVALPATFGTVTRVPVGTSVVTARPLRSETAAIIPARPVGPEAAAARAGTAPVVPAVTAGTETTAIIATRPTGTRITVVPTRPLRPETATALTTPGALVTPVRTARTTIGPEPIPVIPARPAGVVLPPFTGRLASAPVWSTGLTIVRGVASTELGHVSSWSRLTDNKSVAKWSGGAHADPGRA
jgi:hypothetical protein